MLYYATGARYEGFWHGDQKHGMGCYCFENGEVGLCGRFKRWQKHLLWYHVPRPCMCLITYHGTEHCCAVPWQVWVGSFAHDRPVLAPGELFAPASTAVTLQVDDLVAEEENPAASRWHGGGDRRVVGVRGWRDGGLAKGLRLDKDDARGWASGGDRRSTQRPAGGQGRKADGTQCMCSVQNEKSQCGLGLVVSSTGGLRTDATGQ